MPSDPNTTGSKDIYPGASDLDRRSLARCWECWDDGEGSDVSLATLKRLCDLGWMKRVGRDRWKVTDEGDRVLNEMGVS